MDFDSIILSNDYFREVIIYLAGFVCVLFASDYFGKYLQKYNMPLITGFLILGIVLGPQVIGLVPIEAIPNLRFLNDVSLAFIAFAAGAEFYVKEIRGRIKSIAWNTFGQLIFTFGISASAIYFLAEHIGFMQSLNHETKLAVALLMGTIFVARSPSSVIAIINELRAKGPFTQTALGVTVVIDVLVIILFTVCYSVAKTLILGLEFSFQSILLLFVELLLSIGFGVALGKLISRVLKINARLIIKGIVVLVIGYVVFLVSSYVHHHSERVIGISLHFEPLLICIIASFFITNRSAVRSEFHEVIEYLSPFIYVAFFTLTGVMMSLDVLADIWEIALLLFAVRLVAMIVGAYVGSTLAKDDKLHRQVAWMPYVTQAGVGLGLAIEAGSEFPAWGSEFATLVIAVIVLNQLLGPPLLKWSLNKVKETHTKAGPTHDGIKDAIIFGLEGSSFSLARQLLSHKWDVKLVSTKELTQRQEEKKGLDIRVIDGLTLENILALEAKKTEAIVLMLSDEENYQLCELIYEHIGTINVIVRLNDKLNFTKFHDLGALIVEPTTAIVSLLDHFVRSPSATSLLMGMEAGHETIDIEVRDRSLHGIHLKDIKIPSDIIILTKNRNEHISMANEHTILRVGDILTMVGPETSLESARLILEV